MQTEQAYTTSTRKQLASKLNISTKTLGRYLNKKYKDFYKNRRLFSEVESKLILIQFPN